MTETRATILARIRARDAEIVRLIVEADRTWWRPRRAQRLRTEARRLLALNKADLDALPKPRHSPRPLGYQYQPGPGERF